jgi:rhodanese-related sulfurtransferase
MLGPHTVETSVRTIDREELRRRLERRDPLQLVMASSDWAFRAKHIPGSRHFRSQGEMFAAIGKDEEVVVYCSNVDCHASLGIYEALVDHGYTRVLHYRGGLLDWEAAGLPLEGTWADAPSDGKHG